MPVYRLKSSDDDLALLRRLVMRSHPLEGAAFALAGISKRVGVTDLLIRRVVEIPESLFTIQHEYHLEVSPKAVNGLASLCEANGLIPVLCHSHPGDIPYSSSDDAGEARIAATLRQCLGPDTLTASLLVCPGSVRGRVWLPNVGKAIPLSEIHVIGRSIQIFGDQSQIDLPRRADDDLLFDREVRAFGKAGHDRIALAKVGIIGVGGTGSPTAEQLVRLGVRDVVLVDPDRFDPTNVTRVYGTFRNDVDQARKAAPAKRKRKVDLLARHLRRINPEVKLLIVPESVVVEKAAHALLDRDVILLCTDDHWGRSVVNQLAFQYLIPTINVGMRISADAGRIGHAVGVVDVLRPGLPCLWCKQYLSADRIAAESMPPQDRAARRREGYVEDIDTPAPSVVSLTTTLSGMAVTQFLQLMTDFMGENGNVQRLNYDVLSRRLSGGRTALRPGCICSVVRAFGDLKGLSLVHQKTTSKPNRQTTKKML